MSCHVSEYVCARTAACIHIHWVYMSMHSLRLGSRTHSYTHWKQYSKDIEGFVAIVFFGRFLHEVARLQWRWLSDCRRVVRTYGGGGRRDTETNRLKDSFFYTQIHHTTGHCDLPTASRLRGPLPLIRTHLICYLSLLVALFALRATSWERKRERNLVFGLRKDSIYRVLVSFRCVNHTETSQLPSS